MAKTPVKTQDQKRAEREARLQQRTLEYAQDVFQVDKKGDLKPEPPGPSIFDV